MGAGYGSPQFPANDAFNFWVLENFPEHVSAADCCGEGESIEEARADEELRRQYADLWAAYLEESDYTYTVWVGC